MTDSQRLDGRTYSVQHSQPYSTVRPKESNVSYQSSSNLKVSGELSGQTKTSGLEGLRPRAVEMFKELMRTVDSALR